MTPKSVTTIDLNDLKEIELRCKCGAAIRLPIPLKAGNLLAAQDCPGCADPMWEGVTHPTRQKLERLLSVIESWKEAAHPVLSIRFVITEESLPSASSFVK
jgi:hypothetical protein